MSVKKLIIIIKNYYFFIYIFLDHLFKLIIKKKIK